MAGTVPANRYRGQRLGLPESGPGSLSSMGRRLVALLIDLVIAGLIASLFVHARIDDEAAMWTQQFWGMLIWFGFTAVALSFFGFTPGMAVLGIRVVRLDGAVMIGPLRAIPRTLLVAVLIPAVIWDADNRGLHDKLAGTVVVRMR